MELTGENVDRVFRDCLLSDDDPRQSEVEGLEDMDSLPDWMIPAEGVTFHTGFVREAVESHRTDIRDMLSELPGEFHKSAGGGMSFLQMCEDKNGKQWTGMHSTVEQLLLLGVAAGYASYPLPREMWKVMPGGVPYVTIDVEQENE